MGKLPKQYKRKDGEASPEKVDVDDELEKQFSRSYRERSSERDRERLKEKKDERQKERERTRSHKSSRKRSRSRDRRRSRSRDRDRRRGSRDRDRKRDHKKRSRSRDRRRSRSRSRDRRRRSSRSPRKSRASLEREVQEKSKETGIAVPEYLARPAEQSKFLEAQAKRKLLWGGKNLGSTSPTRHPIENRQAGKVTEQQKLWASMSVGDNKTTSKFQKLMGANKLQVEEGEGKEAADKLLEKQKTMFNAFENQYASARQQTHFSKGKGFGL
ncbi:Oidioi.mRNA.OKI2018_I69.PAR.g9955.t1.cds [Oikopleura dioica]|uniref:Arginine/serine-rich coiled-coil protein 2 n=1 Tax=Oikopleura dioica TaxID=34765 RepID=A0ABN7RVT7_OIKDI|nr:Oidioi.mRNA.OKI2018_I69.PAR.g9955.t1.cds [Oikopleura dioica]